MFHELNPFENKTVKKFSNFIVTKILEFYLVNNDPKLILRVI